MYDDNIEVLRARVIAANPSLGIDENSNQWWLLGTSGCHLCDIAEQIITQFQAVQPISYQHVDIAEFSVMDLQQLLA